MCVYYYNTASIACRGVCRDFLLENGKEAGTQNERLKNSLKIENVGMPYFENNKSNNMCRFFLSIFFVINSLRLNYKNYFPGPGGQFITE